MGNVYVSRYPSPQFVRTGFTDRSSRLSVSPTVCDQKIGVLVHSAYRVPQILPLSLLGQHMDGPASEWFPGQSVTSTLCLVPVAPLLAPTSSPWPTTPVLPPFSMLEAFTRPLDWSTQLFSTFVWHPRLSTLPIYYFVPPRRICGIVPPPRSSRSSSLIDTQHKFSRPVWDVRVTIGRPPIAVFLY